LRTLIIGLLVLYSSLSIAQPRAMALFSDLTKPWGMTFLPDSRLLISQKPGQMVILDQRFQRIDAVIQVVPEVYYSGQGGLLDVALDPDFESNQWLYWSYAEAGLDKQAGLAGTAVARGRLVNDKLQDIEVIYRQYPKVTGTGHYGSRLVFGRDKTLFITLGERQKFTPSQDLSSTLGKVVRINRDGSIPADNPVLKGARAEIYSFGHRNPQGAALHPLTGQLWVHEHGPQGGDEINLVKPAGNYGWPYISYGCHYGDPVGEACRIGEGTHAPDYIEPISYWVPLSIEPSGMMIYNGDRFPQWRNDIFLGALAGRALWRVKIQQEAEVEREALFSELNERIRDVEQGPDGWIYMITDSGKLFQIKD